MSSFASSCWSPVTLFDLVMDSNSNLINASIIVSIAVFFSYLGFLGARQAKNILWYLCMKSVEINGAISSCGDLQSHLMKWLQTNASTKSLPHLAITASSRREDNGHVVTELANQPSFDTMQYFEYKGHWVFLYRRRLPGVVCYDQTFECTQLSTFRFNSWILTDLLEEVRALFEDTDEDPEKKTRFFFANEGYWSECGNGKRKRPLSSVILNESILSKIVGDVNEFLASATWYQDRGIPYRRGYLLYGPPGCGKSSFVKAIAGEINYDICILSLSSKNINDDTLNNLMNSTQENCIILLEDIDAAFPNREDAEDAAAAAESTTGEGGKKKKQYNIETSENGTGKVTLRGLLNALDGVASTEGRIIFLTTNYIDRLDPAMTRPGRVDLKVLIDLPDDDQLTRMFNRFYPDAQEAVRAEGQTEDYGTLFVKRIRALKGGSTISMAMIQGHFMMHKKDFREMLDNIENYFEEQFFSLTK